MPASETTHPTRIGPFRIVRTLGEGGMGVVYLGERLELFSQRVAIKVLHPEIALLFGDEPLRKEEYVLTSLDHPGIVRLLDRQESDAGRHYIVMEYVDGFPLMQYCAQHPCSEDQRVRMILEVAQAVEYAHQHTIIHGDLKPQNILVSEAGHPRLLDFGVAAMLQGTQGKSPAGAFTPDFASPEQMAGERLTAACDVYSLGKVAKALLGNAIFKSDLSAVIGKATRVDPEERYRTVGGFIGDLQAVLENRPVSARQASCTYLVSRWVRRNRTAATMAAVVAFVILGSLIGVAVQTARANRQRRNAENQLRELVRLTGSLEGDLYRSAQPLAHAEQARAILLSGASQTLDTLVETAPDDPQLALEMARQYETLCRLELAEPINVSMHRNAAKHDLERSNALLAGPAGHGPLVAAELQRISALSRQLSQ